jgi:hypothetical protein
LSTQTNKKGDVITASVVSPEAFKGDTVEGKITESKSGAKVKGKSVLTFTFGQLYHVGRPIQISSQIESVTNSQGKVNVDEEGRVVQRKNSLGKVGVATGLGAVIGAIAGGGKGAAIGAGAGAAAAMIFIQVGTEGPNVTFASGSRSLLNVKER